MSATPSDGALNHHLNLHEMLHLKRSSSNILNSGSSAKNRNNRMFGHALSFEVEEQPSAQHNSFIPTDNVNLSQIELKHQDLAGHVGAPAEPNAV